MTAVRRYGVLVAMLLAGCGGPKFYPVEGTVTWTDGKPALELVGGAVNFEPTAGNQSATGPIVAGARYQLGTSRPGNGVPAGEYRVTITRPPTADPDKPSPSVLHPDYERLDKTKLKVTVEEKRNDFPLKLERRK
jgi:hypothetical protein